MAGVGMTEKEARDAGHDVIVGAAPYGMNPLGMLLSENEGIVEVVADKKYERKSWAFTSWEATRPKWPGRPSFAFRWREPWMIWRGPLSPIPP